MRFVSAFLCAALVASAAAYLEPNRGQSASGAAFLARTPKGTLALGSAVMGLLRGDGSADAVAFEGATAATRPISGQPLPGVSHYARGNDPAGWIWDVPHYQSVRFPNVYPGIDAVYHIAHDAVELDFVLSAGADPHRIRFRVPGSFSIDGSGALTGGSALLRAPAAWQIIRGKRIPVDVRFLADRRHRIYFHLGSYDPTEPLTIDPVIQFATFLGGSGDDIGMRVIAGSDGTVYTAGNTTSADFPATLIPGAPILRPGLLIDQTVYLTRLKSDFSTPDWSIFVGGTARQSVFALKQDAFGNLYLLGDTTSPNFPVTAGAIHTTIDPSLTDLFLLKLDAQTGHIKTGTFLGIALYTNQIDAGAQLAIDAAGGMYVAGSRLFGGSFTPTPSALESATPSSYFAMRLNAAMSSVVYATYWTIGSIDGVDVDAAGNLWIAGTAGAATQSSPAPFPAANPLPGINQSPASTNQAYIARLNPTGTALASATLLHGDGPVSSIADLKFAPDGSVYVSGWNSGANFPQVHPLSLDPLPPNFPAPNANTVAPFLARLAPDAQSLLQSTFFYGPTYALPPGSVAEDNYLHMALLPQGGLCLFGLTPSASSQTPGALFGTTALNASGGHFQSLGCVDADAATLSVRTALPLTGGAGYTAFAPAPDGTLLLTGSAGSSFVTTPGVAQPAYGGNPPYTDDYGFINTVAPGDAFLVRLGLANPAPAIRQIYPDSRVLDTGVAANCSVSLFGSGFSYGASATLNGQPAPYSFVDSSDASVSFDCNALQGGDNPITVTVPPPGGGTASRIVAGINGAPYTISVSPASVPQGTGETKVVIRANDLRPSSVLYWNGGPRAASFVLDSPSTTGHFELILEPPELAQPASIQVAVSNPAPGGGMSPIASFAIQPSTGAGVPTLSPPSPFVYSATGAPYTQVLLIGSGFTSSTIAFWDGTQAPVVSFTSTQITIQPPAADLKQLGAHDIYVSNGSFASSPVRLFVGRTLVASGVAYDPTAKLLYALVNESYAGAPNSPYDLQILDAITGNLVSTVPQIAASVQASALSADGSYLYLGVYSPATQAIVLRYSTRAGAVDLQWQVPPIPGSNSVRITSLATPPNSPQTVIVATDNAQVLIYDGNQPRSYDSIAAGFIRDVSLVFTDSSRIYTGTGPSPGFPNSCWTWMDYDAFGISAAQIACGDPPPELQHDSGLTYLTDGVRTFVTSLPWPLGSTTSQSLGFALDLNRRHAWQLTSSYAAGTQLLDYAMDAKQFLIKAELGFNDSPGLVYSVGDGTTLLVLPSYILRVP